MAEPRPKPVIATPAKAEGSNPSSLALLRLLTWLSPAFPTGGFSYSGGLEYCVESGAVTTQAALSAWLEDSLAYGALWSDAILVRHAYRAPSALPSLAELAASLSPAAERRLETIAQGAAFARAAAAWPSALQDWGDDPLPYPVAIGALAAAHGVPEDDAALAFLHAGVANAVSAAIRLIPLGQTAGLFVQAALECAIIATAAATKTATLDDLGTASWAADIAAMRHETQTTRLFRT